MKQPTETELDDRVRHALLHAFRLRVGADSRIVLLGHGALLALVAVLVQSEPHRWATAGWLTAVLLTTVLRAAWMRRAADPSLDDAYVLRGARLCIAAHAAAWSLGAAAMMPILPMADLSIMLIVLAGIGAGSLATLAADAPSFEGFLFALSIPLPFGILAAGRDRPHVVAVAVVIVFTVVMLSFYRRAHASLVEHTRTAIQLAASRETQGELIGELQEMLARVKTLGGLLPICANCKKIRDDRGYWSSVERYVADHSDATFSHGLCPDCQPKLFPGVVIEPAEGDPAGA